MVLFSGPSSTTWDPIGATQRPSEVPPPLSMIASLPLISLIAFWMISINLLSFVKYGSAFWTHDIS